MKQFINSRITAVDYTSRYCCVYKKYIVGHFNKPSSVVRLLERAKKWVLLSMKLKSYVNKWPELFHLSLEPVRNEIIRHRNGALNKILSNNFNRGSLKDNFACRFTPIGNVGENTERNWSDHHRFWRKCGPGGLRKMRYWEKYKSGLIFFLEFSSCQNKQYHESVHCQFFARKLRYW